MQCSEATTPAVRIRKIDAFDGVLCKRGSFLNKAFPVHFHQEWSFTVIEAGSELLSIEDTRIHLNTDALVAIPPGMAHANQGHPDARWAYASLYIDAEAAEHVRVRTGLHQAMGPLAATRVTYNRTALELFRCILDPQGTPADQTRRMTALFALVLGEPGPGTERGITRSGRSGDLGELLDHLASNFQRRMTLDTLSETFHLDKYKLLRRFRSATGLTPQEYITSLRIEQAKLRLSRNEPIIEVALDHGFFDQSHFTKVFLKYVGMTPGEYQRQCARFSGALTIPGDMGRP